MLSKIISIPFFLFTVSLFAHPLVDFVRLQNLDTQEGRELFLTEKLSSYVAVANELNLRVQALSLEGKALSPETDQAKILEISQEIAHEMERLLPMLLILEQTLSIGEDFEQIEAALQNPDEVSSEQEKALERIASICQAVAS